MVTTLVAVPEVEVCWGNGASVAGRGNKLGSVEQGPFLSHRVAAPAELAEEDLSLVEAEAGHFGEERHLTGVYAECGVKGKGWGVCRVSGERCG